MCKNIIKYKPLKNSFQNACQQAKKGTEIRKKKIAENTQEKTRWKAKPSNIKLIHGIFGGWSKNKCNAML